MPELQVRVLGPLEVLDGDRPVRVPPGRRRAVLACLLVHLGHPVPADTLVEAAWADGLPEDPRAALHTVLSRLRTVLGPGSVRAASGGYVLDLAAEAVDAQRFERLCARARSTAPADAQRLLAEALALWRGRAYADLADPPSVAAEAARLERLRLDALEALASAAADAGDTATAVATLEALLAEDPFRERALELLMTSLYRTGRQAEALERYRAHRTMLAEELGLDPSPVLRDLEARILGHRVTPPQRPRVEPPAWVDTSTAFIGRDEAVAELVAAVAANRVVTVTGPGGVGKTRLVAESLPGVADRLHLPITVVELAATSAGRAAAAVADSLGLRSGPAGVADAVVEYLGTARRVLVLDNCEHLLDEVATLVGTVARRSPRLHVVATSRHRLGVASEIVLPLPPLPVPAPGTGPSARSAPAVRLFADRVRRLRPTFAPTGPATRDVGAVCRALDGLPLALELAASAAATVGVHELAARLPAELPGHGSEDLHAVVEWSHRLLSEEQRGLLACLSVFTGDFDLVMVRGMAGHLPWWRGDVTRALGELVEASLVSAYDDGAGTVRYRLLAIVRAFAARRLVASGHEASARTAHAEAMRDLAEGLARDWPEGDGRVLGEALGRRSAEITSALRWTLEAGRLDVAGALGAAVMRCLHWAPGRELGELVTEVAERAGAAPDPGLADALAAGAFFAADRGELDRARRLAGIALEAAESPGGGALTWLALGVTSIYAGDHAEATAWFGRLAASGELVGEGSSSLALLACFGGDLTAAHEHAAVALAAGPSAADASRAFARYAAGEVESRTDPARGATLLREAIAEADRVGAEQVSRVSRVALLALLVRGEDEDPEGVAALAARLLRDLRRVAAWPQLWTTLRVCAELLAADRPQEAVILLAAAGAAPSAPPLVGEDVERYAALHAALRERLGGRVVAGITGFATTLSRSQVADRAIELLEAVKAR